MEGWDASEWNPEEKIKQSFAYLSRAIAKFDPVAILAEYQYRYLFNVDRSTLQNESVERLRQLEFLTGLAISKGETDKKLPYPNGDSLCRIKEAINTYFLGFHRLDIWRVLTEQNGLEDSSRSRILQQTKNTYLNGIGVVPPQYFEKFAYELYAPHREWMEINLGFSIEDVLTYFGAYFDTVVHLYSALQCPNPEKYLWPQQKPVTLLSQVTYTREEMCSLSHLSSDICSSVESRFSAPLGYHNPLFPDTYDNPFISPWDYNTMWEKPWIRTKKGVFAPIPYFIPEAIFKTLNYDLMKDSDYFGDYGRSRGSWFENEVATVLKKIFPQGSVHLNPQYPDGKEFCDVLVIYERNILIFQCKTKSLRYNSAIGVSFEDYKDDFKKAVAEPFNQGFKAKEYLDSARSKAIICDGTPIALNPNHVQCVQIICVGLSQFHSMTAQLSTNTIELELFENRSYPWSLSIYDLDIVCKCLRKPELFIRYSRQRQMIDKVSFNLIADERELLGVFLKYGEFKLISGFDLVLIDGHSQSINEILFDFPEEEWNDHLPQYQGPLINEP